MEILHHFEQKSSDLIPLLSITFPKRFRISQKFGHWTSGNIYIYIYIYPLLNIHLVDQLVIYNWITGFFFLHF